MLYYKKAVPCKERGTFWEAFIMEYALQRALTATDIKLIRKKLKITQSNLAELAGVSVKTVERWESGQTEVKGPIVTLLCILREHPGILGELEIHPQKSPLRLRYYFKKQLCTVIDVDDRERRVEIKNYVSDPLYRAFGVNEHPDYEEYEEFLESRCFPRTRDKMKLILRDLNLPFYDPFLIIEKTGGRMAEDDFWIQIER